MHRYFVETIKRHIEEAFFNVSVKYRNDPKWDYNHEDHENEIFIALVSRRVSSVENLEDFSNIEYSFELTGIFELTDPEFNTDLLQLMDQLIECLQTISYKYPTQNMDTVESVQGFINDGRVVFKVTYTFNFILDLECIRTISQDEPDEEKSLITGIQLNVRTFEQGVL